MMWVLNHVLVVVLEVLGAGLLATLPIWTLGFLLVHLHVLQGLHVHLLPHLLLSISLEDGGSVDLSRSFCLCSLIFALLFVPLLDLLIGGSS